MYRPQLRIASLIACAAVALSAIPASAATVQDLVRIKGQERNVLMGMGIVVGLPGTGDTSKSSMIAARPYAAFLANIENQVASLDELIKADAYAIVTVTMELPATGVREGDRVDVAVDTLFNAKSLRGGRLIVSLLYNPLPKELRGPPMAQANGSIVIEGENLRSGVVREGGQMIGDVFANPVTASGDMTLVLKDQYAGYPNAVTIASAINDEYAVDGYTHIATAVDGRNIRIVLPEPDRASPAAFIASVMVIPVDSSLIGGEARIVINEKQGIILVTGNVEIGPVGITHGGLSITSITPPPVPSVDAPIVATNRWVGVDTTDRSSRGSTRLLDLLKAFDQLNVPVKDQIAIVYELKKTGALHAEIVDK